MNPLPPQDLSRIQRRRRQRLFCWTTLAAASSSKKRATALPLITSTCHRRGRRPRPAFSRTLQIRRGGYSSSNEEEEDASYESPLASYSSSLDDDEIPIDLERVELGRDGVMFLETFKEEVQQMRKELEEETAYEYDRLRNKILRLVKERRRAAPLEQSEPVEEEELDDHVYDDEEEYDEQRHDDEEEYDEQLDDEDEDYEEQLLDEEEELDQQVLEEEEEGQDELDKEPVLETIEEEDEQQEEKPEDEMFIDNKEEQEDVIKESEVVPQEEIQPEGESEEELIPEEEIEDNKAKSALDKEEEDEQPDRDLAPEDENLEEAQDVKVDESTPDKESKPLSGGSVNLQLPQSYLDDEVEEEEQGQATEEDASFEELSDDEVIPETSLGEENDDEEAESYQSFEKIELFSDKDQDDFVMGDSDEDSESVLNRLPTGSESTQEAQSETLAAKDDEDGAELPIVEDDLLDETLDFDDEEPPNTEDEEPPNTHDMDEAELPVVEDDLLDETLVFDDGNEELPKIEEESADQVDTKKETDLSVAFEEALESIKEKEEAKAAAKAKRKKKKPKKKKSKNLKNATSDEKVVTPKDTLQPPTKPKKKKRKKKRTTSIAVTQKTEVAAKEMSIVGELKTLARKGVLLLVLYALTTLALRLVLKSVMGG